MEYQKLMETKIVRVEHHVVIWPGGSAADLMQALRPVPIDAKLHEIEGVDGTSQVRLIFLTENAVERHDAAPLPSKEGK